jgi:hypothetical protein
MGTCRKEGKDLIEEKGEYVRTEQVFSEGKIDIIKYIYINILIILIIIIINIIVTIFQYHIYEYSTPKYNDNSFFQNIYSANNTVFKTV